LAPTATSITPKVRSAADDFKRGVKRDKTHYPVLKDDKYWDNFYRSFVVTAVSHNVEKVLDPTYVPTEPSDKALFEEQKKFVYSALEHTLQTAADFTAAIGNLYTRKVRELEEAKDEEDVKVKPPAPFSKETKWIPFFKLLVNYLSSVTGVNKVPLDYVVRKDDDVAAPDTEFKTEHEKLVLSTPHTGTAFNKDNGKVWIQVKQLTVNGPAWTYVAPFEKKRDGRGAVKALNSHYEGDAVVSKSKAAAFDVLEHTTYTGECRNFGMERYTKALSTAFQTLDEYGETLTESRKVDVFLRNNHCTNPKMLSGIAVIQGDADRMSNFAKVADYLALFTNTNTSQKTGCLISSAQRTSNNKKKPAIRAGNYTPNEWHQLSDKEKDKVRAKRAAAKSSRDKNKRSAAAITRSSEKPDKGSADGATNAGDQFALSNKKKKRKTVGFEGERSD
jgi:hypothetical protein